MPRVYLGFMRRVLLSRKQSMPVYICGLMFNSLVTGVKMVFLTQTSVLRDKKTVVNPFHLIWEYGVRGIGVHVVYLLIYSRVCRVRGFCSLRCCCIFCHSGASIDFHCCQSRMVHPCIMITNIHKNLKTFA